LPDGQVDPAGGSAIAHTAKAAKAAPATVVPWVRRRDRIVEPFVRAVVLVDAIVHLLPSRMLKAACGVTVPPCQRRGARMVCGWLLRPRLLQAKIRAVQPTSPEAAEELPHVADQQL